MYVRIFSWLLGTGSLFIVGLTVSRGALLGIAIALTIGFRRLLKRGFIPVLVFVLFAGLLLATGLFDQIASKYEERGTEETGRTLIWVAVVDRIIDSPLLGVGIWELGTYVSRREMVPHNSFLFLALTSGVIPFGLWIAFWIRAAVGASHGEPSPYKPFQLPLLVYVLLVLLLGDINTSMWVLVALSVAAGPGILSETKRVVVTRRTPVLRARPKLGSASQSSGAK
jgi:O-antigen ligase